MAGGADHHQRLAGDQLGLDVVRRFAKGQNGQIEPSTANLVEEVRGATLAKPHLDPGMLGVKRGQQRGQVRKAGRLWTVPIASFPRFRPFSAATASRASWTASSATRALSPKSRPAAVSRTCRVVRTKSFAPSSSSSARTELDSADWTILARWAARVKCCSSATAMKCLAAEFPCLSRPQLSDRPDQ